MREAEVQDLHETVAQDKDVGGLDVAVNDPLLVGVVEALADLDHDRQLVLDQQALAGGDQLAQFAALQEFHDDVELALLLTHVVDGHDVGVVEAGTGLGLAEESRADFLGDVDVVGDDLEGHQTVQLGVAGLVDYAHPPPAYPLEDLILPDLSNHADRCLGAGLRYGV